MKNYFITLVLLLIVVKASGQYHPAQYKTSDADLRKDLVRRFGEEARKESIKECLISVVFVKFTIDTTGNIKIMSFSASQIPQVFRNILQKTILATSGYWISANINGKKIDSKPFILPLIIELEAGCAPKNSSRKEIPDLLSTNITNILEFEDNVGNTNNQLDCVLLKPLRVFAQN